MHWNYELETRKMADLNPPDKLRKCETDAPPPIKPSPQKTLSLLVTAQKTDEMLATKPPDEMISSSMLETLKNAVKPHSHDPAHQISVLPD